MKNIFDLIFSLIGLFFFLPVFIIVPLIIFLNDFGNPFYTPYRIGKRKKKFKMFKFRSMILDADKNNVDSTKNDDQRITMIGKIIRKFKFDELSQLLNVIFGSMSLVGPRPNVEREVNMYSKEEIRILDVKPGITDFSSIVFADEGDILEGAHDPDLKYNQIIRPYKSRLAILYVEKKNLILDIQLIFLTILSFLNRKKALNLLSNIVFKISHDETLRKVCLRNDKLKPTAPPGFDKIITKRF